MTLRQKKIWKSYWYIAIRYNSWANEQYVSVKSRKIDKQDKDLFLRWCQENGDNMYCSQKDAKNRRLELLNVFK